MTSWQAILLAVVEGVTEFLPVSSTGHLILASSVMGIAHEDFTKLFTISIQFGAILSVVVLYWRRFFQSTRFYTKLLVAFLPAALIGKLLNELLNERIDLLLENVTVVVVSLLTGGVILLFVDHWFQEGDKSHEDVSFQTAFWIGCFQTIAMIPGVSRSAATIIGGLSQRLTRKAAAEFSFFLAVPTMFAATLYKLYSYIKEGEVLTSDGRIGLLLIGNLVAFGVALLAIKSFISYLTRHGFKIFGYYRILLGLALIGLHLAGVKFHF
ncbi:MAG: undecaprenyl-diphosphate phosphatase [Deltaproteobacteria bacterium]|nr:undecaprenyl-diphosphate phosphatase [Deltaproteobacteria bacterium]